MGYCKMQYNNRRCRVIFIAGNGLAKDSSGIYPLPLLEKLPLRFKFFREGFSIIHF